MDNLDRDGVSKADGDDATSVGNSTNASGGVGDMARNHKERKLENVKLKEQSRVDNDKKEKMRAEYEELRRQLEEARIGKNEGTQAEVAEEQQTAAEQHGADAVKNKENQMEVDAPVRMETAAAEDGAAVSETTGTMSVVDATPNNAEAGKVQVANDGPSLNGEGNDIGTDAVKKTLPDENAEGSQTKGVTFAENHNGKTQAGAANEQPTLGTGGE